MAKVKTQKHVTKSSLFPFKFDSSTTLNIGEFVPASILEITPHSHVKGRVGSAARLAPMVNPTFGKCFIHDYVFNIRLSEVYPLFDNIISQIPTLNNAGNKMQPTGVPLVDSRLLYAYMLSNCQFSVFPIFNVPGKGQIYVPFAARDLMSYIDQSEHDSLSRVLFFNIMANVPSPSSDYSFANLPTTIPNIINSLSHVTSVQVDNYGIINDGLDSYTDSQVNLESCDYTIFCSDLFAVDPDQQGTSWTINRFSQHFGNPSPIRTKVAEYLGTTEFSLAGFQLGINLNYTGKYLRKILFGLGYKPSPLVDRLSVLPLVAYFKTWFELFNPKRDISFQDTACFKYFDFKSRCQSQPICDPIADKDDADEFSLSVVSTWFFDFLSELTSCYFSVSHNYLTLCRQIDSNNFNYVQSSFTRPDGFFSPNNVAQGSYTPLQLTTTAHVEEAGKEYLGGKVVSGDFPYSADTLNLVQRFSQFISNKRFVPQSIKDYFMSKFGVDIPQQGYLVGVSNSDLNFDDVFQTATTSEGYLGEYAGRSVGSGSKTFSFKTDNFSYCLVISCIIPRTQYVDGCNPLLHRLSSLDFYDDSFDGLTFQMIPETEVFSSDEVVNASRYPNIPGIPAGHPQSFGVAPIYQGYKVAPCGILNGDLSLRSTRNSFVGFTLDSVISKGDIYLSEQQFVDGKISYEVKADYLPTLPVKASQLYRFISPINGLSNLQRIFINGLIQKPLDGSLASSIIDDTIVLHHILDFEVNSYMLPSSHSYETFDLCELESSAAHSSTLN